MRSAARPARLTDGRSRWPWVPCAAAILLIGPTIALGFANEGEEKRPDPRAAHRGHDCGLLDGRGSARLPEPPEPDRMAHDGGRRLFAVVGTALIPGEAAHPALNGAIHR